MARARAKPKSPTLDVFREFPVFGHDDKTWTWRIAVPRRFTIRSVNHYQDEAGARRYGRAAARELGIRLARKGSIDAGI